MRKNILFAVLAAAGVAFTYGRARAQKADTPSSPARPARAFTMVNLEYQGSKIWLPSTLIVKKGEKVKLTLVNKTPSGVHGFAIDEFKVLTQVADDKSREIEFTADKAGLFRIYCHMHPSHIGGQILVLE